MIDRDITKEKIPTIDERTQSYLNLKEHWENKIKELDKQFDDVVQNIKKNMGFK